MASDQSTAPEIALAYGSSSSLFGLKRWPARGLLGAVDAVAVELARPRLRQVDVPDAGRSARAAGSATVSGAPYGSSNRQSSTASACSLNSAKLTPLPSQVAPSGYGCPGCIRIVIGRRHCEIRAGAASARGTVSIPEALVDDVEQRLAALEAAEVLVEDRPDEVHRQGRPGRVVRRDDQVGRLPEGVAWR